MDSGNDKRGSAEGLIMDRILPAIFNISLTAIFVIAALLLTRLFLCRTPKVIPYTLLAVVLFNLLYPFKPESVFNLTPFRAEPISEQSVIAPGQEFNSFDASLNSMQAPGDDVYISFNPGAANPDLLPDSSGEKVRTYLFGSQAHPVFGGYRWRIGDVPFNVNENQPLGILDKIYLGMTNEEVYELFGVPDFQASGLMWYGYNDIGIFDPSFGFNGLIERITLANGWSWSVHDLINAAVKRQNMPDVSTDDVSFEWHEIVDLEATERGFTVNVISQYERYLPDGEYNVRRTKWAYSHIELAFAKNEEYDYVLTSYNSDDNVWLVGMEPELKCYTEAMYFFVGALPSPCRFGLHRGGTAAITNYAECSTVDDDMFLISYFPGATLAIEEYDDQYATYPSNYYSWVIEYANSRKNITVGKDGTGAIPITDDMIGIYSIVDGRYEIKFERYVRAD